MVGRKDKKLEMHSTTELVVMKKHPKSSSSFNTLLQICKMHCTMCST